MHQIHVRVCVHTMPNPPRYQVRTLFKLAQPEFNATYRTAGFFALINVMTCLLDKQTVSGLAFFTLYTRALHCRDAYTASYRAVIRNFCVFLREKRCYFERDDADCAHGLVGVLGVCVACKHSASSPIVLHDSQHRPTLCHAAPDCYHHPVALLPLHCAYLLQCPAIRRDAVYHAICHDILHHTICHDVLHHYSWILPDLLLRVVLAIHFSSLTLHL